MSNNEHLGWDEEIADDGSGFTILPDGEYVFRVSNIEKTVSNNSGAPMAIVTLQVEHEAAQVEFKDYLVLTKASEWKLCSFFRALGMKKHGEPLRMQWDRVEGKRGKAEVFVDTYTGKNGDKRESNKVKTYLDPPEGKEAPAAPRSAATRRAPKTETPDPPAPPKDDDDDVIEF